MAGFNRIKQFWHAIFSKLTSEDYNLVNNHLSYKERSLFFGMDRPTQTHCVRVARSVLGLLPKYYSVDKDILLKAALLHDIGKPPNIIRTFDRVFIVLLKKFAPNFNNRLTQCPKSYGRFHQALIAHTRHPYVGAEIATNNKLPNELISLIQKHHQSESPDDPPELKILREADNLN